MNNILTTRETWITIDLNVFKRNLQRVKELAGQQIVWPAVKANCYGHGIDVLFPAFIEEGIDHFCVAYIDEARNLQMLADSYNVAIEILIFGDVPIHELSTVAPNWHITVAHADYAELLLDAVLPSNIQIQIKIDSGMNRRGFKSNLSFMTYYKKLQEKTNCKVSGIYTHFATADNDPNSEYMLQQIQTFHEIVGEAANDVQYFHAQNSFGLANLFASPKQTATFNAVRPGGICYGLSVEDAAIQPIASLYTKIMEVKKINKGEFVGYNITFSAPEDGYIAVLPIGYADGIIRRTSGNHVWLNGELYPIVGKICMEQCMIYTTNPDRLHVGDTVEFFGAHVTLAEFARYNQTIDYEVMCSLAPRIKRITIEEVI